jgi:hypothetical protein
MMRVFTRALRAFALVLFTVVFVTTRGAAQTQTLYLAEPISPAHFH